MLDLTQALIRLDTSNPPGNETPAAELLADYLGSAGVECELVGPDPARLNLIARIEGAGRGPSMMLLAHTDVVPAPDADWTVAPFEGDVTRRTGRRPRRGRHEERARGARRWRWPRSPAAASARPATSVLIAEADEERNTADVGMSWLVRERPDLRCDFAINEGGGVLLELADGRTRRDGRRWGRSRSPRCACASSDGRATPRSRRAPTTRSCHASSAVERLLDHRPPIQALPAVAAR